MKSFRTITVLPFLILTGLPATATTLKLSGSGNSLSAGLGVFAGPTFSFEIEIDASVPFAGSGGNSIAYFEDPIKSFKVDGVDMFVPGPVASSDISFSRQRIRDILSISADSSVPGPLSGNTTFVSFSALYVPGFFGSGPSELSQLVGFDLSAGTSARISLFNESVSPNFGSGEITSLHIVPVAPDVIPLPASAWLLFAGLGALGAASRGWARTPGLRTSA